ncbi:type IV pilus assembly protein FimV [Ramlibacter humi]|uniref:Tetratricopeptide repeat protein n=1 Tax=Ramlibacter humi TaxID=2530451 RepID=A0A4Z0C9M2_9BURK|nr:hypothetical protein [Ramlibacter humi]TFZ08303.1 hypothetical protein EZ216_03850 [Ramlibacter humi]
MKTLSVTRTLALALAGFAAASAWGLSLGRAQGVALIGRPLEVGLPVLFEPGDPPPECVGAEVFYGDTRVEPNRVSAELLPSNTGAGIRVRSPVAVNEPVVTVYVHLGCTSRLTRKVVLLSEQPSLQPETARAVAAVPVPAPAAEAPAARPSAAVAARPQRGARAAAQEAPSPMAAPARARQSAASEASSRPAAEATRPAAKAPARERAADARNKAKLELEPLDLSPAADPRLRQTDVLATGEGSPEQRAVAQALWRALNADPQALLRDSQRVAALEREVAELRAGASRKDAALARVQAQVEEAKAQRYANPLVFALAVLLLAAIAFAAYAWRRGGFVHTEWWRPGDAQDSLPHDLPPAPEPLRRADAEAPAPKQVAVPSAPVHPDFDVAAEPALSAARTQPLKVIPQPPMEEPRAFLHGRDFQDSHGVSLRSMKAEELHDVQQEADFFMALGEHERAIEVLRSHIGMNPETSAVAWLDLLGIYHRLGREEEFDYTRGEFERNFNARVPDFADYENLDGEGGLEDYPNAVARITALWPSRRVLDVIEDSIFRSPAGDGRPAFSLAAYRDLLMLHHVGEELLGREVAPSSFGDLGGISQPPGFSATNIHPLSAEEGPADGGFGLDIDLDLATPPDEPLVGLPTIEAPDSNMLDFDLPDMDVSSMKTKKTRE